VREYEYMNMIEKNTVEYINWKNGRHLFFIYCLPEIINVTITCKQA